MRPEYSLLKRFGLDALSHMTIKPSRDVQRAALTVQTWSLISVLPAIPNKFSHCFPQFLLSKNSEGSATVCISASYVPVYTFLVETSSLKNGGIKPSTTRQYYCIMLFYNTIFVNDSFLFYFVDKIYQ